MSAPLETIVIDTGREVNGGIMIRAHIGPRVSGWRWLGGRDAAALLLTLVGLGPWACHDKALIFRLVRPAWLTPEAIEGNESAALPLPVPFRDRTPA